MRSLLLALALFVAAPITSHAQTDTPVPFQNGFAELHNLLGDQTGAALTGEYPNPLNGDTLQMTSTGMLYWSDAHWPTWTNGWLHVALGPGGSLVRWEGDSLDPPAPPTVAFTATVTGSGSSGDWPIGGSLGQRIYCVEGIESSHGRFMWNPVGLWYGNHIEHAAGWLGFMATTARAWGAVIGNRASEWAAAARMILAGRGSAFFGIATGRC